MTTRMQVPVMEAFLLILLTTVTMAAPEDDEVTDLPGLRSRLPWKHYSGYLNGMFDKLHYW